MSGTALAFWQGLRMYRSGEIAGVGTVFTVVLSVTLGATSTILIFPQFEAMTNAGGAAAELFSTIDRASRIDPLAPQGIKPESCTGDILIRDLNFAYPTRKSVRVLDNLQLKVPAGKTTALVGPSGCGKSTLIGLLERWYTPASGSILLDGHDVSEYNIQWLRSNIRLVQQEPVLFQGTVYQNVIKGLVGEQQNLSEDKKMELVRDACIKSNAHEFIEQLPEGYHTQVGERASMLSGGQRQRVAIARSIISDPKVLLLDEATSALDPRAESIVQQALNRVSANKTTLVIAHKLATVKAADNIAVMNGGKVIEQGTHTELLERDGLYAAMVRAQDLGAASGKEKHIEEEEDRRIEAEEDAGEEEQPLGRPMTLQRTKSMAPSESQTVKQQIDHLAAGTVNYSLLKCIRIMLLEHKDLFLWYLATIIGSVIGGGTYPAQAVLFSRLINVFTLQGEEARTQGNFYALMFFVLAIVNLFGYFAIGWACNTIGATVTWRYRKEMVQRMMGFDQVSSRHHVFSRRWSTDTYTFRISSIGPRTPQVLSHPNCPPHPQHYKSCSPPTLASF
jgi:ATP-binding cassette, subfamily B (MDR/TAP), member 1